MDTQLIIKPKDNQVRKYSKIAKMARGGALGFWAIPALAHYIFDYDIEHFLLFDLVLPSVVISSITTGFLVSLLFMVERDKPSILSTLVRIAMGAAIGFHAGLFLVSFLLRNLIISLVMSNEQGLAYTIVRTSILGNTILGIIIALDLSFMLKNNGGISNSTKYYGLKAHRFNCG